MNIVNNIYLTTNSTYGATAKNQVIRLTGYMLGGYGYKQTDFPDGVYISVRYPIME